MTTKLRLPSILLAALAVLAAARAESSAANSVATDAERAIERAYLRADGAALDEAVKPLDAALSGDPKNPALLYERAFGHYAAEAPLRVKNNKAAMLVQLDQAVALLERVKGQPWEAEAAALHGTILGQIIGLRGGMAGMTLGPKSNQLINRADKALPGNPRILLFRGSSLLNTPAEYGGDPAEGTKLLQQAADIFAAAGDAGAPGPHWGRADALAWLGVAKHKTGDTTSARAAWEQALALEPDYAWVKFALLPSLDQKPAK